MKAARLSGFNVGLAADDMAPLLAKGDAMNIHASSPRALTLLEIAKNLVAGSNIGLGDVLVYGAPHVQAETS
jgi:hypothetical protein